MDPRRVLTFRVVAHEGSFSRAARVLALSQPSVSAQVAALETQLGTRLLDRGAGGLRLTPAGTILLEHADAIQDRFDLATRQLAELRGPERLRIGAFPTALAGLVPSAIARLREAHPGAEVSVEEVSADVLPARVASGELHIAIGFQDAEEPRWDPDGLERHDLLREAFLVALAAEHPRAGQDAVALRDLAAEHWTAALPDGIIARACRAAGFEPQILSITHDQLAIRALIARGLAVTLAPELLTEAFTGLALRPIDGPTPQRDIYALLPPGGRHPLARPLLDALRANRHDGAQIQ
jgi:DNA-binding transcriptional LysR family regulator